MKTTPKPTKTPPTSKEVQSGPDLMHWRQERGIPRSLFCKMADFSERKMATIEKAPRIPKTSARPITETMRLIKALQELAGDSQALKDWLQAPNPAFDKATPLDLIKNGNSDLLWEMVHQLRQGTFA